MSVGNINSYGDKKNNFTWQYKMLQGLDALFSAFSSGGTSYLAPKVVRTGMFRETAQGEIADLSSVLGTTYVRSITFANLGGDIILIKLNGTFQEFRTGEIISYDAGTLNNTFNSSQMGYDTTGATDINLLITYTY